MLIGQKFVTEKSFWHMASAGLSVSGDRSRRLSVYVFLELQEALSLCVSGDPEDSRFMCFWGNMALGLCVFGDPGGSRFGLKGRLWRRSCGSRRFFFREAQGLGSLIQSCARSQDPSAHSAVSPFKERTGEEVDVSGDGRGSLPCNRLCAGALDIDCALQCTLSSALLTELGAL